MSEDSSKILVTGASGKAGTYILDKLRQGGHEVIGTAHKNKPTESEAPFPLVNLADARACFELIHSHTPEIVVHTAANSNIDICEIYQQEAWITNVITVKNLIGLAMLFNYRLIFISTEQVYGEHGDAENGVFKEDDFLNPVNFYAKTKKAAEEDIRKHLDDFVILRLALVYGWGTPGHASWCDHIYQDIKDGITYRTYSDQLRSMIYVKDIAEAISKTVEKKDMKGIFNLGGEPPLHRDEFTRRLARHYEFPENLAISATMDDFPPEAPRPKNCALDISKIKEAIDYKPTPMDDAIADMASENPHTDAEDKKQKED